MVFDPAFTPQGEGGGGGGSSAPTGGQGEGKQQSNLFAPQNASYMSAQPAQSAQS